MPLDVVTIDARTPERHRSSLRRAQRLQQAWRAIEATPLPGSSSEPYQFAIRLAKVAPFEDGHITRPAGESFLEPIDMESLEKETVVLFYPASLGAALAYPCPPALHKDPNTSSHRPFLVELGTLVGRNLRETFRNWPILTSQLIQILVFILLLGLVFLQLGPSQTDIQNRMRVLFFFVISVIFTTVSPLLNFFPVTRSPIKKERASGMYRSISVYPA